MRCGIDEYVDKLTAELTRRVGSPAATTLLKQINKVDKRTVDINGVKIDYYSVSNGGIQNLAVNTAEGIFIQKDITATKAIEYLNGESVDSKLRNTLEVKKQADDKLHSEYGVRLENLLKAMDNNQVRKFLLLHEHRHNMQVAQRKSRQEFMKEYKEDPVKFEYDANKFALVQLGKISKKIIEEQPTVKPKTNEVYTRDQELAKAVETINKNKPFYKHYIEDKDMGTVYPHTMLNGKVIYLPAAGVGYYYVDSVKKQVLPGTAEVSTLGSLKAAVETEVAYQEGKTITTSDGKVSKNPDIEYLIAHLNWAKEEIQVPASDGYKFMIQGIIERAEEGLAKTEGLSEFVVQFKKDIAEINRKRAENVAAYFDHVLGTTKPKVDVASKVKDDGVVIEAAPDTKDLKAQANTKEDIITETALDAIPDEGC